MQRHEELELKRLFDPIQKFFGHLHAGGCKNLCVNWRVRMQQILAFALRRVYDANALKSTQNASRQATKYRVTAESTCGTWCTKEYSKFGVDVVSSTVLVVNNSPKNSYCIHVSVHTCQRWQHKILEKKINCMTARSVFRTGQHQGAGVT